MLVGECALPQQHAESVGGAAASRGGSLPQGGVVRDDVAEALPGVQEVGVEGQGVSVAQAEAGGVDDEVGFFKALGQFVVAEAAAVGLCSAGAEELFSQGGEFGLGAVDEGEAGAVLQGALAGEGGAGAAAGAEDEDSLFGEGAPGEFGDGAGEAWAVGVAAEPAVSAAHEGVDGAAEAGEFVELFTGEAGLFFEGDGDVGADELLLHELLQQATKVSFSEAGEQAYVAQGALFGVEDGLVHLGGEGVGNGVADDGEGDGSGVSVAGVGAVVQEVFECVDVFHGKREGAGATG